MVRHFRTKTWQGGGGGRGSRRKESGPGGPPVMAMARRGWERPVVVGLIVQRHLCINELAGVRYPRNRLGPMH